MNKEFVRAVTDGPEYIPCPEDDEPCCRSTWGIYSCTRNADHPMPHAAHGAGTPAELLAIWDGDKLESDDE